MPRTKREIAIDILERPTIWSRPFDEGDDEIAVLGTLLNIGAIAKVTVFTNTDVGADLLKNLKAGEQDI